MPFIDIFYPPVMFLGHWSLSVHHLRHQAISTSKTLSFGNSEVVTLKGSKWHFFGGGLKNLKVPMPRPKIKIFKKNLFFIFSPPKTIETI